MRAKKKYRFEPDYAVPPGETLLEVMKSLQITQKSMAIRLGLTQQSLIRIIKSEQPISYETANRLELVTQVSAKFWNNLEATYREQIAKLQEREQFEHEIEWLRQIPVNELIARGAIRYFKEKVDQLREVLRFYGVGHARAWRDLWVKAPAVATRRSQCFDFHPGPASVWVRLGELQAQNIECKPHSKPEFMRALKDIRKLTKEDPIEFVGKMRSLCAESGVALAFVPEMKKVPWNGATKWLTPEKAMIILNLRGKGEDKFWFSFFHEASHVLNDSKKDFLINDGSQKDPREKTANAFAADFLIPSKYDQQIRKIRCKAEIINLAMKLGISPGIVAGRYQHLKKKWSYYKGLIRTFKWEHAS